MSNDGNNSTLVLETNELGIIKMSVYLLIMLFSITGNTLVILSVLLFQRLKTVPNIFIANLAACDFITTVSSIPFDLGYEDLGYWPYGGFMCKVLWPLATFSTTAAVFTLLSISGDRYGALLHPLNFGNKITKKKCFVIIVLGYVLASVAVIPYIVFLKYHPQPADAPQCSEEWPDLKYRKAYTVFLFSIQYAIPLPIMAYIYIRLGLLLYDSTRVVNKLSGEKTPLSATHDRKISQISNNSFSSSNINRTQRSIQRRKEQNEKTVKMFLLIVAIFLIFMLPNQILWILYDFGDPELLSTHIDVVAFICRAFTYTNSVLNAIIYGACNNSFRMAFKSILRCRCGKRHQRDLKRSLSINQGRRSTSTISRRKTHGNHPHRRKIVWHSKPDSSETVEGTSNSFEETYQANLQISDSVKNAENSTPQSPMNNYRAMGKTSVDSEHSRFTNDVAKEGPQQCILEAERLLNKISHEMDLEKSLNDCTNQPKETTL